MKTRLAPLALAALLGACATAGPDYEPPVPALPAQWSAPIPYPAPDADLSRWWRQFEDPMLTALTERALERNRDVLEAIARIQEARALSAAADARALPSLNASAGAARERASEHNRVPLRGVPNPVNLYQAGFDASWEIDLFGGVKRAREAAGALEERAVLDREATGVSVGAEAAASYLRLRGAQSRLGVLQSQIAVAEETSRLVGVRLRAGLVSEFDWVRAQELVASLEARIPALQAAAEVEIRRLGVLCGGQPGELLQELAPQRPLPALSPRLPAVAPAELLARRADLRAIERGLAAESARIGVAEAERYPRLALGLGLGLLSLSSGNLASGGSALWNAGASARAPAFDGGGRAAQALAAHSRYQQAAIRYERAAVAAAEEVELAAVRYAREQQRGAKLAAVVRANEDSRNLALSRYRSGLGDFFGVLDAQRQLFAAQDDEIVSREQSLTYLVALYKALGGGWQPQ